MPRSLSGKTATDLEAEGGGVAGGCGEEQVLAAFWKASRLGPGGGVGHVGQRKIVGVVVRSSLPSTALATEDAFDATGGAGLCVAEPLGCIFMAAEASGVSRWLDRGRAPWPAGPTGRPVRPRIPGGAAPGGTRQERGPVEEVAVGLQLRCRFGLGRRRRGSRPRRPPRLAWPGRLSSRAWSSWLRALMARMVSSSASGTPALRAILLGLGTSMVSAPRSP